MMPLVEVLGLRKHYGDREAVAGIDFNISEGEFFGLLGPNGAGKTTTILMLAGVIAPSSGTARIAGFDVVADRLQCRRGIGFVPQELALYEDLTATQNLRFFGSLYDLGGRELAARIGWALEVAGLAERADERVGRYSGGMKRRLNLVAGLLHQPRLLILDEPTAGVDAQSRAHIFECVRRLRDELGTSILYTSHYLEEVQALCDRVGILDQGRLVAVDTVRDLLAAHGGDELELELRGDAVGAVSAVAPLGAATVHDGRLRLRTAHRLGEVVHRVEASGTLVLAARRLGADLESVFLSLTGRPLRDA
jgi:ABC-2 type transport system ATP-binding protein